MGLKKWVDRNRLYLSSWLKSRTIDERLRDLRTVCLFVGYPRSGHSLVGSVLDAHPNVVIAHELDVLKLINYGYRRNQLFHLLLENSANMASGGRTQSGYSYDVPNQWQGRFAKLEVLGDKKGGQTSLYLYRAPQLLDRLRREFDRPIKFVHVIRNPYDVITTMMRSRRTHHRTLEFNIDRFFQMCEGVELLKKKTPATHLIDVGLEAFIQEPKRHLEILCSFLEVEATEDYLRDCAGIIFRSPKTSRQEGPWTKELIQSVKEQMSKYSFFDGYSFEDGISGDRPPQKRGAGSIQVEKVEVS